MVGMDIDMSLGRGWIYPAAKIGCRHEAAAGVDLVHLDQSVCETADHICGIVQMTCLFLVQLGHRSESIWSRSVLNDRLKGLHSVGVRLEEGNFGVATSGSLILSLETESREKDRNHQPGNLAVFPVHTARLEAGVNPGYRAQLAL